MAAPASPMQREPVGLVVIAVLLTKGLILRRLPAGDEGRQPRHFAALSGGLLRLVVLPRLMLIVALLMIAILLVAALLMIAILLMLAWLIGLLLALLIGLRRLLLIRLLVARGMRFASTGMRLHGLFAVVVILIVAALLAALGPLLVEGLALPELLLRHGDQSEIMLRVLVIILGGHRVA